MQSETGIFAACYVYVCMYVCTYTHMHAQRNSHFRRLLDLYIHVCMSTCMYVYMHVYMYT